MLGLGGGVDLGKVCLAMNQAPYIHRIMESWPRGAVTNSWPDGPAGFLPSVHCWAPKEVTSWVTLLRFHGVTCESHTLSQHSVRYFGDCGVALLGPSLGLVAEYPLCAAVER